MLKFVPKITRTFSWKQKQSRDVTALCYLLQLWQAWSLCRDLYSFFGTVHAPSSLIWRFVPYKKNRKMCNPEGGRPWWVSREILQNKNRTHLAIIHPQLLLGLGGLEPGSPMLQWSSTCVYGTDFTISLMWKELILRYRCVVYVCINNLLYTSMLIGQSAPCNKPHSKFNRKQCLVCTFITKYITHMYNEIVPFYGRNHTFIILRYVSPN